VNSYLTTTSVSRAHPCFHVTSDVQLWISNFKFEIQLQQFSLWQASKNTQYAMGISTSVPSYFVIGNSLFDIGYSGALRNSSPSCIWFSIQDYLTFQTSKMWFSVNQDSFTRVDILINESQNCANDPQIELTKFPS